MNTTERMLERLKHHITTGALSVKLGCEGLSRITVVPSRPERQSKLQDLGAFTKNSIPFPLCDLEELRAQAALPPHPSVAPEQETKAVLQEIASPLQKDPEGCGVCKWQYPASFTASAKQRHQELAQRGQCAKDCAAFRHREERKAKQMMEKEKLMNGEDPQLEQFREVRSCPHCGKNLEGSWGPFKRDHLLECEARNLDHELNSIVSSSALIPKKRTQPEQDRFAIAFTSLVRKRLHSVG